MAEPVAGETASSPVAQPRRGRQARVLLASPGNAPPPLPTDYAAWPSHVLQAAGRAYHWRGAGPLSIKMFLGGTARYRCCSAAGARYAVDDASYLLLNHGHEYEITIEADAPVESFCLFFRAGLAEEVARSLVARPESLLDEPGGVVCGSIPFYERTYPHDAADPLSRALFALRASLDRHAPDVPPSPGWVDEQTRTVMERLLARHAAVGAEVAAFGASAALLRPATRDELYRRLHVARDFIADACAGAEPLTLDDMARVACLSPNHFLRTFRALFGQTPHQYLTARRLAGARRLLLATDLPVTEVCLRVGFVSLGSFSSLFARRFGLSPERYRRLHRTR